MPKRDMQDVWSLLADLARELSWFLKVGFFGGLLLGACVGTYLAGQVPADEVRRGFVRILVLFVLGTTALGGFLGLVLGVIVELAVKAVSPPPKDDPRKRERRRFHDW